MALSFEQTGKYTSERHQRAIEDGKRTAGQVAELIRKNTQIKVSAKDIISKYQSLYGRYPEWHHSGFFKKAGRGRKQMGRTYFFSQDEVDRLFNHYQYR